jgi:outer membrane protein OmpA-like peptidoglycan-associated protein
MDALREAVRNRSAGPGVLSRSPRLLMRDITSASYQRGYQDGLSGAEASPGPLAGEALDDYNEGYLTGKYDLQNQSQPNPDQPNPDQPNPDQPNPDQPNPDQPPSEPPPFDPVWASCMTPSTKWSMSTGMAFSGGEAVVGIHLMMQLRNDTAGCVCKMSFDGVGIGVGLPAGMAGGSGSWQSFTTAAPVTVSDFNNLPTSRARLYGGDASPGMGYSIARFIWPNLNTTPPRLDAGGVEGGISTGLWWYVGETSVSDCGSPPGPPPQPKPPPEVSCNDLTLHEPDVLFNFGDETFATDPSILTVELEAKLGGPGLPLLDLFVQQMVVQGHTDSHGEDTGYDNMRLSRRRANAVIAYLTDQTRYPQLLALAVPEGHGFHDPLVDDRPGGVYDPTLAQLNRRVVIHFDLKPDAPMVCLPVPAGQ